MEEKVPKEKTFKNESAVTLISTEYIERVGLTDTYNFHEIKQFEEISKVYIIIKRLMDLIGAFIGILFFTPILVILIACIKIENWNAPVFFSQKRAGLNGEEFIMYKFRSMIPSAETELEALLEMNEATGAMFKMANDPRVTKIGKFIRKTSLDELPQLWNVLKGDMSLVGPRPPLPREVKEYSPYDMLRLSVVPGCTGLWQVSGRSNIGFKEMVALDIKYIKSRSIKMDAFIIMKTFFVLFGSKDAY